MEAVVSAAADVFYVRLAGNDLWLSGTPGLFLYPGDSLMTCASEGLVLSMPGGANAGIGAGSFVTIRPRRKGPPIAISRGSAYVTLGAKSRSLGVQTPAYRVDAGRESEVQVVVEPGAVARVTVWRGEAAVSTPEGGRFDLGGYRRFAKAPGGPPGGPEPVPTGERSACFEGYRLLAASQVDPYFRYEAAREKAESDGRSETTLEPFNTWAHVNLGRALVDRGALEEARAEFERAAQIDQRLSAARAGLGRVALLEGRWEDAGEEYGAALRFEHDSVEAAFGLGQAALCGGDLETAQSMYKRALEIDAEDAASWAALGAVRFLAGDYEKAGKALNRAGSIDERLERVHFTKALVRALEKYPTRAVKELKKIVDIDDEDFSVWNCLGCIDFRSGRLGAAARAFRRLEGSGDVLYRAVGHQNLSVVEMLRGEKAEAVTGWEKSLDLVPDRPPVLVNLGFGRLALGEGDLAVSALGGAVLLETENWYLHDAFARVLWDLGDSVGAEGEARRSAEFNTADWSPHLLLCLALAAAGEEDGAKGEFDAAVGLLPDSGFSGWDRSLLGEAYLAMGEPAKALAELEKAAGSDPDENEYVRLAGDALKALGREEDALARYREAVRLEPADAKARIKIARLLNDRGDRNEAVDELLEAVEYDPYSVEARLALAGYMLEDGDVEDALFQLKEARAAEGIPPRVLAEVFILEGNALDRRQDFGPAIDSYNRALTMDPSRGDAWFYLAGDYERTGRPRDAIAAYAKAVELCAARPEWSKFQAESAGKLVELEQAGPRR